MIHIPFGDLERIFINYTIENLHSAKQFLFDSQFIIIQRYNRPRVIKLLEKEKIKANIDRNKYVSV